MNNDEQLLLAYLASFFDGEGCLGVYPRHNGTGTKHVLMVQVGGTDEESRRLFHRTFGASFSARPHHDKRNPHWSPQWRWSASGEKAKAALTAMLPYLRLKRAIAVEALKTPISRHGHHLTLEEAALKAELSERIKSMIQRYRSWRPVRP